MTFLFSPHHFSYRSYRIKPLAFDTTALSTILTAGATDSWVQENPADRCEGTERYHIIKYWTRSTTSLVTTILVE